MSLTHSQFDKLGPYIFDVCLTTFQNNQILYTKIELYTLDARAGKYLS
jgi:hypothetical protein